VDASAHGVPLSVRLLLAHATAGGGDAAPGSGRGGLARGPAPSSGGDQVVTLLLRGTAQLAARGAPAVQLAAGDCAVWPSGEGEPALRCSPCAALSPAAADDDVHFAFAAVQFRLHGSAVPTAARAAAAVASAAAGPAAESLRSFLSHAVHVAICAADEGRAGGGDGLRDARSLAACDVFSLPGQTNRLALLVDPLGPPLVAAGVGSAPAAFTFGVELFEAGHATPLHAHADSHELFLILAGRGTARCDGVAAAVQPGDCVIFPPASVHGLDVDADAPMLVLELMTPDDGFAAYVRSGAPQELGLLPFCKLEL
jgi:mannose-6-phosphate isomerase-like protein (cupin superfamily)